MLADDLIAFTEAGPSLSVGLVDADGRPVAMRGFGCRHLGGDPPRVGLLVPEATLLALGRGPGCEPFAVAVTLSAIVLLRSVQMKGTARAIRVPDEQELARARADLAVLFEVLHRFDGIALGALPAVLPERLLAVDVDVVEVFDQTPGPGAGRAVGAAG